MKRNLSTKETDPKILHFNYCNIPSIINHLYETSLILFVSYQTVTVIFPTSKILPANFDTFQSVALQTLEILNAMELDSKLAVNTLLVDGGMTNNDLLMQTQADFLGNYVKYSL